ncbi:Smr/MutS family protein [Methylobacterium sp. Leaf118]|uniref:Smr/MutS family protein n=1 Tax=Methylobacterium sp. Leaf118 TaxID=2876562 RepID=UPI001E5AF8D5|nr:Smr/MutS family protein [Methylobacterium sp. Leaf118]
MRLPRRPRRLTREEAHLWGEIAKLITPLRDRARIKPAAPEALLPPSMAPAVPALAAEILPATPLPAKVPAPARPAAKAPKPAKPVKLGDLTGAPVAIRTLPPRPPGPAAPPGLERRERRGLERGTLPIEARIDLHGLYQSEAHAALVGFLMRSRAAGHARVLVVTGKGGDPALRGRGEGLSERGVLRRSVPHWLRGPDLRGIVLGFEESARQHGGEGALYVRLRRR